MKLAFIPFSGVVHLLYTINNTQSIKQSKKYRIINTFQPTNIISITSVHRCSECVMTDGVCGWCQLDFTCTGDNSTCTGGSDNWLTVSI